jgi:hypothetical protein
MVRWTRRPWLPWALGGLLVLAVLGPALDPSEQVYYRDTLRCVYHFKQFIAAQLRAGQSPFWDPWTESGTSVLVQITPGLFHPATLLYLLLPFELAFKLNHLLAVPLAWVGLYLLARKAGASNWGAAAGACGFAACGHLASMTGSSLPFALGAATMPLALHGFLRFVERPRPLRLLWAGYALALCFHAGEPQSMLFAGYIGAVWVVGGSILRRKGVPRALLQTAAWGSCALLLAAPAITPVLARLGASARTTVVNAHDRASFANAPVRLAGLLLPWAFDDALEASAKTKPYFTEYFAGPQPDSFSDSIVLGAPILLLAFAARRRCWPWLLGALFFALASAGDKLGFLHPLELVLPGQRLFRYPEKLIAPVSMLICFSAAFGIEAAGSWLALGLAAFLGLSWLVSKGIHARLVFWLQAHGRSGGAPQAEQFLQTLQAALLFTAALAFLYWGALQLRRLRPAFPLPAALAALCAVAGVVQTTGRIYTAPLELLHAPLLLADELKGAAGPSEGRWRIRGDTMIVPIFNSFDLRYARTMGGVQALNPQFHALAQVEGATSYSSLTDGDYEAALSSGGGFANQVLGVRFDLQPAVSFNAAQAAGAGYRRGAFGAWVKEFPARPRAFLAGCARPFPRLEDAVRWLSSPAFAIGEAAVRDDPRLPCPAQTSGEASLLRSGANDMQVRTDAPARSLLIVAEHYDPGWRATVDGQPAPVLQADLVALSVVVPEGRHEVALHFVPNLLWLGLCLCGGCVLLLSLLELLLRRRQRVLA